MPKRRVTITLEPDVWRRAQRLARQRKTSASALIEAAIRELPDEDRQRRIEAARALIAMSLPVGTPEEMEEEIERGRMMCLAACMGDD